MRGTLVGTLIILTALPSALAQRRWFDRPRMQWADRAIETAIERGEIPGAVLLVGRGDKTLYRKSYGHKAVEPEKVRMTADTIFDMASLSKVVGCATSIMLLVERGQINLPDKVSKYIPAFGRNGKENITVEQLLLHRGGLIPDNPLADYAGGVDESMENIYNLETVYEPGTAFRYTDVGYIVLGELVRVVDDRPLDQFAREEIFAPLGMRDTGYDPPDAWKLRCAPTEQREGRWMIGEVHDPRAYRLGGVAGHAGLFSTADDLATWCRMILRGGTCNGKRILSEMTVREMTRQRCLPDATGCRGFGFDVSTRYSSARGNLFEAGSTFGHTGFTGTMFWIDPRHDAFVILLTNRVHPNGKGRVVDLRRRVVSVAAAAIIEQPYERYQAASVEASARPAAPRTAHRTRPSGPPPNVLCGIDVLKRERYKPLEGKRVAVITNHTGRDRDGNRTVDLLVEAKNVNVVKLFSPEHGFYGKLDRKVGDTVDDKTQLKVYSLYGRTRRPTPEMLEAVDTIVFDVQDIGARFYTYVATMGNAMEVAAEQDIEVIVLDRPNPIRGVQVAGPIADEKYLGFTAFRRLPVTHGMTVGELATMFNVHHGIKCKLTVVQVEGWKRTMWWDETGLMWTHPSPNMRNLTQAILYPAIGLLEASNLSVGRGTDQPFEFLGGPWIDGRKLAAALNGANLPGLRFVPIEFTPDASKFKNEPCRGIYIMLTDREILQPVRTGLTIAWHLHRLFGDAFEIKKIIRLMDNEQILDALLTTKDPAELPQLWAEPLEKFKRVRDRYLLY